MGAGSSDADSPVVLSVDAGQDGLRGAATASLLALAEGDVTAVCHDAGELRDVWGRRREDHETRLSIAVRRLATVSIASRPSLPLNATAPVFVEALTSEGQRFDASQHAAMGLAVEVVEHTGHGHGLAVLEVKQDTSFPGGRGIYYSLRALRPGVATLQATARACRPSAQAGSAAPQDCPEVRSSRIEVHVHMPLGMAPTAAGMAPGSAFALRVAGGPPQLRSARAKKAGFKFLASSSAEGVVAAQPWMGRAGGASESSGNSAAVYVAARSPGTAVVTAECVARSSRARRLEPQHVVEAALGSGAVFPRDAVLDFAVASLRVAVPSAISVELSSERSPEGTSVRASVRGS